MRNYFYKRRTKRGLLKKAAEEKRRQAIRRMFQKAVKKVIYLQGCTVGRGCIRKPCGCIVSRPGTPLPYTARSDGAAAIAPRI